METALKPVQDGRGRKRCRLDPALRQRNSVRGVRARHRRGAGYYRLFPKIASARTGSSADVRANPKSLIRKSNCVPTNFAKSVISPIGLTDGALAIGLKC